jgi:PAS domain S-box-containing protein
MNESDTVNAGDFEEERGRLVESFYRRMMDEVVDYAIILLNTDGTIINWNRGAEKIKGYKDSEILGKNFRIFYLPDDRASKLPEKLINEAATTGRAVHEGWRIRKDGSRFWGSIAITALHDDENNVTGFVKVTRDLSERKLAEDVAKQFAVDLQARNEELEQFAYIASHDLQEPMRKIQTFIQLIDKNQDNPELIRNYLGKINVSAQRMASLIRAILNYSRLTNYQERFAQTDLNEVLEQVILDFEILINEKGAVIERQSLPVLEAIPLQINQLFSNLIGNSLKFSLNSPRLRISSRIVSPMEISNIAGSIQSSAYAELLFEDNGIGFDQQYVDQIFTMFRRLHSHQEYTGTGIGLALCKKIAENHHGFIQAMGKPGQGASFRVYLPLQQ